MMCSALEKHLSQMDVQLDEIYLPNVIHSVPLVTSSKTDHIYQNYISQVSISNS